MAAPRLAPLLLGSVLCASGCQLGASSLETGEAQVYLRLVNRTAANIYVVNADNSPTEHWTALSDAGGEPQPRATSCMNKCGAKANPCDAALARPLVVEVRPGEEIFERWDGITWEQQPAGCVKAVVHATGRYTVSMCWSYSEDGAGRSCVTHDFELGRDVEVRHEVTAPAPRAVTFRLTNPTAESAFVMSNVACSSDPGWVSLERDGQPIVFAGGSGRCGCICGRPCLFCAAACVRAFASELLPGASVEYTWDGRVTSFSAGGCGEPQPVPAGKMSARFCFGFVGPAGADAISDNTCVAVPFDPYADGVVQASVAR